MKNYTVEFGTVIEVEADSEEEATEKAQEILERNVRYIYFHTEVKEEF